MRAGQLSVGALLLVAPATGFLFPLLFPVSIRVTFTTHHKPPPPEPVYHFQKVPVYKEIVVKGSSHPHKGSSYGDSHKGYGDTYHKVYTNEHHVKGPAYAAGYSPPSDTSTHIEGSIHISAPETHVKGTAYVGAVPETHYKGTEYGGVKFPQTHHKGTEYGTVQFPETHYGTDYGTDTHYKGEAIPETHYKGEAIPGTHYKGEAIPETHYKGEAIHYDPGSHKNHYLKPVGGSPGYKISDYVTPGSAHYDEASYEEPDKSGYEPAVAIPGNSYSEIAAAHQASSYGGGPKAYAAHEYADLGSPYKAVQYADTQHKYVDAAYKPEYVDVGTQYRPKDRGTRIKVKDGEHDSTLLDDSLPAYKVTVHHPAQYADRSGLVRRKITGAHGVKDLVTQPTTYAGYGTSIYGDSYARVAYRPRNLKISLQTFKH